MPIGLPLGPKDFRPDDLARKMLEGKVSCIFNTPCRQTAYAGSYPETNEIDRKVMEKGLSAQSHAISHKIREIDVFLDTHPEYKNRLWKSHPELCFAIQSQPFEDADRFKFRCLFNNPCQKELFKDRIVYILKAESFVDALSVSHKRLEYDFSRHMSGLGSCPKLKLICPSFIFSWARARRALSSVSLCTEPMCIISIRSRPRLCLI